MILNTNIISKLKILCVEDDPQKLLQLELSLKSFCKELLCAKDGAVALEILKSNKIDLIITDINMPKVNGLELLEIVKNKYKNTKVIIVTGYSKSDYLLKAIRLKVDGYILKPLNLQELFSVILNNTTPKILENEFSSKNTLLKILKTIGGKRVQIIEHIFNNIDEENQFIGTYDEITTKLNASKPTVVNTFKALIDDGILARVKNGQYELLSKITA